MFSGLRFVIVWRGSRYDIVSVDFNRVDMSLIVLAKFKEVVGHG